MGLDRTGRGCYPVSVKRWQFTQAKARLGAVINAALSGEPQEIQIATKKPVVVLSREDFDRLAGEGPSAWAVLQGLPRTDVLTDLLHQIEED